MPAKHFRQGDVLLMQVNELPDYAHQTSPEEAHRIVLAYGEVTGHAHAVSTDFAALYEGEGERYLKVKAGASLVHEEHSAIDLEPGIYKVVRQREYVPQSWRIVAD